MRYFLFLSILFYAGTGFAQKDSGAKALQEIYTFAELMPEPSYDMHAWLKKWHHYPKDETARFKGNVYVMFTVATDGRLVDVKAAKGLSPALDSAAVKTVRAMPNWNSGKQGGLPVPVRLMLPIPFDPTR